MPDNFCVAGAITNKIYSLFLTSIVWNITKKKQLKNRISVL